MQRIRAAKLLILAVLSWVELSTAFLLRARLAAFVRARAEAKLIARVSGPPQPSAEAGAPTLTADEQFELDAEGDDVIDEAINMNMQTVAMDWGDGNRSAAVKLRHELTSFNEGPESDVSQYEAVVPPPPFYKVYYRGRHERSFWRQGRDAAQLCVPVPYSTKKSDVRFRMETKTHIHVSVGEDVIFDRELAHPVYRESSFWYFEDDGKSKVIVIELDKRLDYCNWPRLFPEDPNLSEVQKEESRKQEPVVQ